MARSTIAEIAQSRTNPSGFSGSGALSGNVTFVNRAVAAPGYKSFCRFSLQIRAWRYGPMPIVRWIGQLVLLVSASGALCHQAWSTELPVKPNRPAQAARPSGRLCTDLNGKQFRWHWANVPFAAVCTDDESKDAKPPVDPHQHLQ
jgi:hypothetical protein